MTFGRLNMVSFVGGGQLGSATAFDREQWRFRIGGPVSRTPSIMFKPEQMSNLVSRRKTEVNRVFKLLLASWTDRAPSSGAMGCLDIFRISVCSAP